VEDANQSKKKPAVETALKEVIDDEVAGDPMGDRKWVRRSLKYLAQALAKRHFRIGPTTVRRLLKKLKYRLFGNCQSLTPTHPDRDKQFRFIRRVRKLFLAAGYPVISVDTKKKELIGNFKNKGRDWGNAPTLVNTHDFPSDAIGRAVPYGIYDLVHNQGDIYVGNSGDTPEFAATAIALWWQNPNRPRFEHEDKLLILCDAGGSNSCRYWRWKIEVQKQLADAFGIEVMVCHYPTGASKWNPIEHRLFSEISKNWAGKPLLTFHTMLNYIRDTTTEAGLKVRAFLIDQVFETGLKYDPEDRANLNLQRCRTCPRWNYILQPHYCSG
jgi:hypothetical protein